LRTESETEGGSAELTGIDPERVRELEEVENARFIAERAHSMAMLERARSRCLAAFG